MIFGLNSIPNSGGATTWSQWSPSPVRKSLEGEEARYQRSDLVVFGEGVIDPT
jgi:hypothetical protein